jgi:hypothetical protein
MAMRPSSWGPVLASITARTRASSSSRGRAGSASMIWSMEPMMSPTFSCAIAATIAFLLGK